MDVATGLQCSAIRTGHLEASSEARQAGRKMVRQAVEVHMDTNLEEDSSLIDSKKSFNFATVTEPYWVLAQSNISVWQSIASKRNHTRFLIPKYNDGLAHAACNVWQLEAEFRLPLW